MLSPTKMTMATTATTTATSSLLSMLRVFHWKPFGAGIHRVIYCIISELHNENTESDWVIRETGDMWWQCISHASTFYMDYTESFVIPSLFYLKQQRQIQHRQTTFLSSLFFLLSNDDLYDTIKRFTAKRKRFHLNPSMSY